MVDDSLQQLLVGLLAVGLAGAKRISQYPV
jgi:hypothetical protein